MRKAVSLRLIGVISNVFCSIFICTGGRGGRLGGGTRVAVVIFDKVANVAV